MSSGGGSIFSQDGLLARVKGETRETLIKQLLDDENYETKTEIHNAIAMSAADLLAVYFMSRNEQKKLLKLDDSAPIQSGNLMYYFFARFRINMISKNRMSRHEATQALTAAAEEEASTSAMKKILGL